MSGGEGTGRLGQVSRSYSYPLIRRFVTFSHMLLFWDTLHSVCLTLIKGNQGKYNVYNVFDCLCSSWRQKFYLGTESKALIWKFQLKSQNLSTRGRPMPQIPHCANCQLHSGTSGGPTCTGVKLILGSKVRCLFF